MCRFLKLFACVVALSLAGESYAACHGCSGGGRGFFRGRHHSGCSSGGCSSGPDMGGGPCGSGGCGMGACPASSANSGVPCQTGTCPTDKTETVNGEPITTTTNYHRVDATHFIYHGKVYEKDSGGIYRPTNLPVEQFSTPKVGAVGDQCDMLIIVNQQRVRRGLRPFIRDESLFIAARGAARYRATYRISGHVQGGMGDFQFLNGANASAAGCAAWPQGMEFGACCVYDQYTYAGAATIVGEDGLCYNHIFVR